jgi:hypothetical protein
VNMVATAKMVELDVSASVPELTRPFCQPAGCKQKAGVYASRLVASRRALVWGLVLGLGLAPCCLATCASFG